MKDVKYGVVILNWNNYKDTKRCIESVIHLDNDSFEVDIYLIDNNSKDGSSEKLKKEFSGVVNYYNTGENKGYTGGNNFGLKKAIENGCDYILILNNDLQINNFSVLLQSISALFKFDSKIGICGFEIYNSRTKKPLKNAGIINEFLTRLLGIDTQIFKINKDLSVSFQKAVCGCAICFKRECIDEIGIFDEEFFMYAEEQDICLRALNDEWKVAKIKNQNLKIYRPIDAISDKQLIWYYGTRNIFCAYKKNICGYKRKIFIFLQLLIYFKQIIYFFIKSKPKISYEIIRGLKDAFIGGYCKGKSCKKS